MGFPLVSYGAINSVFFGVYGHTLRHLVGEDGTATNRSIFIAGCLGGLAQLPVACPVDVVKVILQSQISKPGSGESLCQCRSLDDQQKRYRKFK